MGAQEKEDALTVPVVRPYCRIFDTSEKKMVERTLQECLDYWVTMHFEYPEKAAKWNIQGQVMLDIVINKQGVLRIMEAEGDDPILEKAAIDLFRYYPPMYPAKNIKGEAVECYCKYPINFRLKD
ncbi:hypothetical protein RCZ04_07420 [Capnocytophaga sp. HP1101]